jgi:hypothetical protein
MIITSIRKPRPRFNSQPQPIPIIYRIILNKAIQIDAAHDTDGIGSKPVPGNRIILAKVVMVKPIFMIKSAAGVAIRVVGKITLDDGAEGGVAVTNGLMVLVIRKRSTNPFFFYPSPHALLC